MALLSRRIALSFQRNSQSIPRIFRRFDGTKRYFTDMGSSAGKQGKPPYPLPEQSATIVPWRFFLIVLYCDCYICFGLFLFLIMFLRFYFLFILVLFLQPGSVIAGISGLLIFLRFNDENRAIPKGKGEKFERTKLFQAPVIGGPFNLIDTEGNVITEKSLLGNWVLLYFGYTSSPDIGPAEVQKMANAIHTLEFTQQLKVLPVFVTIDPQRDNPSHLKAYLREFDSRIIGLTGPAASVRQMAQEYRVFFKKADEEGDDYLVESSHNMYLLNPNMVVTRSLGVEYSANDLVSEITKEMMKTRTKISQS